MAKIQEVTIPHLAQACDELGMDYALIAAITDEDGPGAETPAVPEDSCQAEPADTARTVLQTGLPHLSIYCDLQEGTLSAFATWEGRLPATAEDEVAALLGDLNWDFIAPTLSYSLQEAPGPRAQEEIVISANRAMGVAEGLSMQQLRGFLDSAFDSFTQVFEYIAQALPAAVTWENNNA
ncbi:hypothetical protein [Corynebacterium lizhenjunii]|uniref:hypothetical protein n=1 Tax=Corynebacterium lizhenjunii TaxID=2709394 RepID=UPI0013EB617F|nr:hypothetical protein [Corynebacterium lizhenjunii]